MVLPCRKAAAHRAFSTAFRELLAAAELAEALAAAEGVEAVEGVERAAVEGPPWSWPRPWPTGGGHTSRPADSGSTRRAHARRSAASKTASDMRRPSVRDTGIEPVDALEIMVESYFSVRIFYTVGD
jgi:hypothetical protein